MSWPTGLSWTPGHYEVTTNPDGTTEKLYVHGGPFIFYPNLFKFFGYRFEIYLGFRPTSPWVRGGNEGLWVGFKRFMQKIGWSNLGFAMRLKKP